VVSAYQNNLGSFLGFLKCRRLKAFIIKYAGKFGYFIEKIVSNEMTIRVNSKE
jgi:hypothetical protein